MGKLINKMPGLRLLISSLPGSVSRMHGELPSNSTCILEAEPGKRLPSYSTFVHEDKPSKDIHLVSV